MIILEWYKLRIITAKYTQTEKRRIVMDVFDILTLAGGLALFLYGMEMMGDGLKKLAGGQLESFLARLTSNRFKGFLLGLFVTAIIQSSSATTVMLVGFVNSGIMKLSQTISIIMGANIGTTVTAWLLSLTGISGDSFFLRILKPESFTPILAVIGVIMIMAAKNDKKKNIGTILVGFAILMFGMETMSGSMEGLKESESFGRLLIMFSNPFMGIIMGTVLTAIIQSSSASVGILQALSLTGAIPYSTAIPIILGQNIGTTITPIISSISGNANSKRVAIACLYIKMIGVIIVALAFYLLNRIFDFSIMHENVTVLSIAIIHTAFNIISTIILMPFCKQIENISAKSIPGGKNENNNSFSMLDERFLSMPSFAVEKSRLLVYEMVRITKDSLISATELLNSYDKSRAREIEECESEIDKYEDKISAYLVKIAGRELAASDSLEVSRLLHSIGDIERISDHSVNIMNAAKEIEEKGISFSKYAVAELKVITDAVKEVLTITVDSLINGDFEQAKKVEPLVKVITKLKHKIKKNHIRRLREGECTVELGFILSDLLTVYDRVAGHCSNIAVCLIDPENDLLESHEYLSQLKSEEHSEFFDQYEEYKKVYSIK